jgi:hypothetical protein
MCWLKNRLCCSQNTFTDLHCPKFLESNFQHFYLYFPVTSQTKYVQNQTQINIYLVLAYSVTSVILLGIQWQMTSHVLPKHKLTSSLIFPMVCECYLLFIFYILKPGHSSVEDTWWPPCRGSKTSAAVSLSSLQSNRGNTDLPNTHRNTFHSEMKYRHCHITSKVFYSLWILWYFHLKHWEKK